MEENYAKKKCWPAKVLLFSLIFALPLFSIFMYILSKEAVNKWFKTIIPLHTNYVFFVSPTPFLHCKTPGGTTFRADNLSKFL